MAPEFLQRPSPGSFVWVSLIRSRKGGSTGAVVALDTVFDDSRKQMADTRRVTRFPARLCSRDGRIWLLWTPSVRVFLLLLFCLAFYFSAFLLAYPRMSASSCSFVCAAVICYSPAGSACSCVIFVCCLMPQSGSRYVLL